MYVLGSEKHETRRIDNQLRGRSGRQGDPGRTQFMVSPQDDIMRVFGGDKMFSAFNTIAASIPDDEPLMESRLLTNRITNVQKQVEGRNFDVRKHVLEYDDVLDQHRRVIYKRRTKILETFDNLEIDNAEIDKIIDDIILKEGKKLVGISLDEYGDKDITKAYELTKEYVADIDTPFVE